MNKSGGGGSGGGSSGGDGGGRTGGREGGSGSGGDGSEAARTGGGKREVGACEAAAPPVCEATTSTSSQVSQVYQGHTNNLGATGDSVTSSGIGLVSSLGYLSGAAASSSPTVRAAYPQGEAAVEGVAGVPPNMATAYPLAQAGGGGGSYYYSPILNSQQSLLRPIMTAQPPLYSPLLAPPPPHQQHPSYPMPPHPSPSAG